MGQSQDKCMNYAKFYSIPPDTMQKLRGVGSGAAASWVLCGQMFVSGQLHCWIYNAVSVKSQRMLQERLIIGRRGKLEADVEVWFLFTFFFF